MPDHAATQTSTAKPSPVKSRRDFLLLFPLAVFAGVTATMLAAAFRFLRPQATATDDRWIDVAPVAQFKGDQPVMRSINAEHRAGWAVVAEEHFVFVLPEQNNRVLSSVCPHEGCNVAWREREHQFFCPCHDSAFDATGARLSGPSRRGLDPLPSRVQDGILQVQNQSFVNNTEERVIRG